LIDEAPRYLMDGDGADYLSPNSAGKPEFCIEPIEEPLNIGSRREALMSLRLRKPASRPSDRGMEECYNKAKGKENETPVSDNDAAEYQDASRSLLTTFL
jgi:hypothetical protein